MLPEFEFRPLFKHLKQTHTREYSQQRKKVVHGAEQTRPIPPPKLQLISPTGPHGIIRGRRALKGLRLYKQIEGGQGAQFSDHQLKARVLPFALPTTTSHTCSCQQSRLGRSGETVRRERKGVSSSLAHSPGNCVFDFGAHAEIFNAWFPPSLNINLLAEVDKEKTSQFFYRQRLLFRRGKRLLATTARKHPYRSRPHVVTRRGHRHERLVKSARR